MKRGRKSADIVKAEIEYYAYLDGLHTATTLIDKGELPANFLKFPWKMLAQHWQYPEKHFLGGVYGALEKYSEYGKAVVAERKKQQDLNNIWSSIHKKDDYK